MSAHGRLLHAKHLFPYLFAPWFQFQRLWLRLDWALFVPLRIASLWTASAVCGVMGVLGAIVLFLFNTPPTPVAASTGQPTVVERIAITIPTELGPAVPLIPAPPMTVPVPPPVSAAWANLQTHLARTRLPAGWDLRERQTLASQPERVPQRNLYAVRDGWFTMDFARQGQMIRDIIQPYISRPGVTTAVLTPGFTAAESVDLSQGVEKKRSPALVVTRETDGPVSLHQETSYTLVVTNPSPDLIESTIVEESLTALHRVVNTEPPATLTPDGSALQWNLANLRSGESRRIRVTLVPETSDVVRHRTLVTLTTRVAASTAVRQPYVPPETPAPVRPPVTRPPARPILQLDLEQPEKVDIGGEVRAFYLVRNTGDGPATDVVTHVTISNHLDHRYGEYLEHRIPELAAGDSRRIKFYAVGARPGVATLTSRLSASNAEPVNRTFEVAIGLDAREGGGSIDPRTFPEGQGNPSRSTVPTRPGIDIDDGLPGRVPSTVPNQPGPGSDASQGGVWNSGVGGEQFGPMTTPFGQEHLPSSTFPNSADPGGRNRPPGTSVPNDGGQWRPGPGSDPSGARSSLPTSRPPSTNSTVPDDPLRPRRRDDDQLERPNRTVVPEKKFDAPSTLPGGQANEFGGYPSSINTAPPASGNFHRSNADPRGPFSTELGEPQPLPANEGRTRGPGVRFPATSGQPDFAPNPNAPTDLFAPPQPAANPGFGPLDGRDRPTGRPLETGTVPFNDPFSTSPPTTVPNYGSPTNDAPGQFPPRTGSPAAAGPGSSIPARPPEPVLIPDPVNSTIPSDGRTYGPMPMVEPDQYPSLLPDNGFFPASGEQPPYGTPGRFPTAPATNPQPSSGGFFPPFPASPEPTPTPAGGEKSI